jgi:hypothetical protein
MSMLGRPKTDEAAAYYFNYIDLVRGEDVVAFLDAQLAPSLALFRGFSEEASLRRYAPDKWSPRQLLGHVNDTERLFVFRALWFARGFDSPLPSFEQDSAVAAAKADEIAWARHIDEFQAIRLASLAFFRNLPAEAWSRRGIASGNPFTVRALAYIAAGHTAHHAAILRDRYA